MIVGIGEEGGENSLIRGTVEGKTQSPCAGKALQEVEFKRSWPRGRQGRNMKMRKKNDKDKGWET